MPARRHPPWWLPGYCCAGGADGVGMSIQRVDQDPIPFLILLSLALLTVWLWRLSRIGNGDHLLCRLSFFSAAGTINSRVLGSEAQGRVWPARNFWRCPLLPSGFAEIGCDPTHAPNRFVTSVWRLAATLYRSRSASLLSQGAAAVSGNFRSLTCGF